MNSTSAQHDLTRTDGVSRREAAALGLNTHNKAIYGVV